MLYQIWQSWGYLENQGTTKNKLERGNGMSEATFRGGVHPYEGKELSKDLPIKTVLPKGELVFSMAQHIGAPAKPVVQKGDKVLVGQKIGEAGGFISANICSSVSGTDRKSVV